MSAKIDYVAKRLPKARNLPDKEEPEFIETHGDELAIFVLRRSGDAEAWVSEDIHTKEGWELIRDFLRQAETGLQHLRDKEDGSR
jgi:hypothetical protein